jgi:hypothetical protein
MKRIVATFLVSLVTALTSLIPAVTPEYIPASVTVVKDCGIDVDTTPINFTKNNLPIPPGETSDIVSRTITNNGNSGKEDCQYAISGTDWTSQVGTMDSEQTDYKCNSGTGIDCKFGTNFRDLPKIAENFLGLDSGVIETVDFRVSIPINQPAGTYTQTITITLIDP